VPRGPRSLRRLVRNLRGLLKSTQSLQQKSARKDKSKVRVKTVEGGKSLDIKVEPKKTAATTRSQRTRGGSQLLGEP
jgi:hypothetical protein